MASGEPRTRRHTDPYLSSLSGDAAERVTIMKWARYLGATFGTTGALRALQYYREINWIGDSVKRTMTEYVRGLPIEDLDRQEDTDTSLTDALASLEGTHFEEHAKSLEFIAAIGDNNIEHSLASLQLTENGSLGMADAAGDLGDRSEDLFTAPGFGPSERGPETPGSVGSPEVPDRSGGSTGPDANGPDHRAGRARGRPRVETDRASPGTTPGSREYDLGASPPETDSGADLERSDVRAADPPSDAQSLEPEADGRDSTATPDDGAGTASDGTSNTDGSPSLDEPPVPDDASEDGPSSGEESGLEDTNSDGTNEARNDTETDPGAEADPDATSEEEIPPDEERCIALTRDGKRCSRGAMDGSDYCKQHAP